MKTEANECVIAHKILTTETAKYFFEEVVIETVDIIYDKKGTKFLREECNLSK